MQETITQQIQNKGWRGQPECPDDGSGDTDDQAHSGGREEREEEELSKDEVRETEAEHIAAERKQEMLAITHLLQMWLEGKTLHRNRFSDLGSRSEDTESPVIHRQDTAR